MGYAGWIGKIDEEDSVLVTMLQSAGAVFYVKTSVPQSLMVCEAVNNVFGRTSNPRNKNWSSGGSSGGEGAIVGFRGSVIGVGTDIGMLDCPFPTASRTPMLTVPCRRIYPCSRRLQQSVRDPSQPRPPAIRKIGQQYGRAGDHPQCLRPHVPLNRRHEAFHEGRHPGAALEL